MPGETGECRHCDKPILKLATVEGVGWYHRGEQSHRVVEACHPPEPLPRAEPKDPSPV